MPKLLNVMENTKQLYAIDLLLEDVRTVNPTIRIVAKKLKCEDNLDTLKDDVIDYLINLRKEIS